MSSQSRTTRLPREPEAGLGKARLAFGPFLALATVEYMLFGDAIVQALFP